MHSLFLNLRSGHTVEKPSLARTKHAQNNGLWAWLFPAYMARVRARDNRGGLHCTEHALWDAWQYVLPPAVISVFYFRYAFISAVWNAVCIRCTKLTYWQTFTCALCLSWSSRLRLNALPSPNTFMIRNWCKHSQLCFQNRTEHLMWK